MSGLILSPEDRAYGLTVMAVYHRVRPAPSVPITYLGAVLGLGGLGGAWRAAHRAWNVPPLIGELLSTAAIIIWLVVALGFGWSWLAGSKAARGDFRDPARAPFAALLPMSMMVAGFALRPHGPVLSGIMVGIGLVMQICVGVWATASLWRGGRTDEAVTPILLMPTVGGFFVGTIAAVQIVGPSLGVLLFGAGLISWLVTESVVLHRLMTRTLPAPLRATLGIHLTPPAIACVAYLELGDPSPDRFAQCLFGYALLQGLVMLRLVPWLRKQAFSHRAWAHTFGIAALPLAALRFAELGQTGPITLLALPLFIGANLAIGWITLRSLLLAASQRIV